MTQDTTPRAGAPIRIERILGRLRSETTGPTLVVMTGIHGNEVSGVKAAWRVIQGLERQRPRLAGEVVFLAGNLAALRENSRFIDLDLNRQWTPERVASVLDSAAAAGAGEPAENGEQRELLVTLRDIIGSARGQLYFLDLHTSSADGPPFVTIGDTLRNRSFAQSFPVPLILGLEEQVDGALLELLGNHGIVTMGVEGGHHEGDDSVDRHESVLWLALISAGILRAEDAPDLERRRALLRAASDGVPPVIEVRYRHAITGSDGFRMRRGYRNFVTVCRGELLAYDNKGPVLAPVDGRILLPLYQGQGDDGFFVARDVHPFWLRVSTVLRRLRLDRLMRFLPGVRRDRVSPEVLIVNTRIVRVYPLEIFHLFGFRKVRQNGDSLIVSRRRYDLEPPQQISFC